MTTLLETHGLSRSFGAVLALQPIDLTAGGGEILGIIGPNGAGKTTLFNAVSGRFKPTTGRVFWRGRDITGLPMRKVARLGLVRTFQEPRFFLTGTVRSNLEMALAIARTHRRAEANERLLDDPDGLLLLSGLAEVAERVAGTLSFGYLRQLGIAMALATRPHMLMLDEPAAGLNSVENVELGRILRRIHGSGLPLVIIDHDMDFLFPLADRIIVLANGKKLTEGTPSEIRSDPTVIEVYLGTRTTGLAELAPASVVEPRDG